MYASVLFGSEFNSATSVFLCRSWQQLGEGPGTQMRCFNGAAARVFGDRKTQATNLQPQTLWVLNPTQKQACNDIDRSATGLEFHTYVHTAFPPVGMLGSLQSCWTDVLVAAIKERRKSGVGKQQG